MITYRESDVLDGQPGLPLPALGSHCAYVREDGNATGETLSAPETVVEAPGAGQGRGGQKLNTIDCTQLKGFVLLFLFCVFLTFLRILILFPLTLV